MAERRVVQARFDEELYEAVRAYAERTGHTVSSALRVLVRKGVEWERLVEIGARIEVREPM
jgi:antitoxin component of RelBE/YafQ-DinJ toxin-antitoxin module